MIKSTEMKKRKEDLVEKLSDEMSQRIFKILEKTVDRGFLEFSENGKISVEKAAEEAEEVEKEIRDREVLTNNFKFWSEICDLANKKYDELLKAEGWKMDDELKYIVPLESK